MIQRAMIALPLLLAAACADPQIGADIAPNLRIETVDFAYDPAELALGTGVTLSQAEVRSIVAEAAKHVAVGRGYGERGVAVAVQLTSVDITSSFDKEIEATLVVNDAQSGEVLSGPISAFGYRQGGGVLGDALFQGLVGQNDAARIMIKNLGTALGGDIVYEVTGEYYPF